MALNSIEGLNSAVQSGNTEKLFGQSQASAELKVNRELERQGFGLPGGSTDPGTLGGRTFSEMLRDSVDQVNLQQAQADKAIHELVAGRNKNVHETMLTIERADSSLKMMMQVRNKILDAYKEIMRMQV